MKRVLYQLIFVVSIAAFSGVPAVATTVTFNSEAGLAGLAKTWDSARLTFANDYQEAGMTLHGGVEPPDPRLGGHGGHYHLAYENPNLDNVLKWQALKNPALEPRVLFSHDGTHVIQMTYDPNQDGIRDPFTISSLDVLVGELNVGVLFPDNTIGVYNNLTASNTWSLLGGFTVTRVTFEGVGSIGPFAIDNIVFQAGQARIASSIGDDEFQAIATPLTLGRFDPAIFLSLHDSLPSVPDSGSNFLLFLVGLLSVRFARVHLFR